MGLFSRAFVPVRSDPLEVEVDHGPKDVSDPGAIVLFRLPQPFGIFNEFGDTERRAIYPCVSDNGRAQTQSPRTCGRRADPGTLIENHL